MRISDWSSDVCSSDLHAVAGDEARETLTGADEQGGGSIAIGEFVFGGRTRASLLRGGDQRAAAIGRTESLDQGAGAGLLARPDVERQHGIWQRQRFLDDAGILAVGGGRADRKSTRLNSSH